MTYEEATILADELRGYLAEGTLSLHADELASLYQATCRKQIRDCNCKDKYSDALIESIHFLKHNTELMADCKYKLRAGVVLQDIENGGKYTNANLTNEVAKAYIAKYPSSVALFETIPSEEEEETARPVKKARRK